MLNYLFVIRDFCWMIYAGPLIGFAVLLAFSSLLRSEDRKHVLDQFCLWGPIFGIAFGLTIFSSLGIKWMQDGHFWLSVQGTANLFFTIGVGFGFLLWVSNIILEVWTLEPIRKSAGSEKQASLRSNKAKRHIYLQAVLACITTVFCALSENL